jgi:hypothetical protein
MKEERKEGREEGKKIGSFNPIRKCERFNSSFKTPGPSLRCGE